MEWFSYSGGLWGFDKEEWVKKVRKENEMEEEKESTMARKGEREEEREGWC